jgi:hypothetical protein
LKILTRLYYVWKTFESEHAREYIRNYSWCIFSEFT